MNAAMTQKSRSLLGAQDLTLIAPIKSGLIPAPDTRTYATRLTVLLRTLNAARVRSKEAEKAPSIADVVDEIRAIRAFRLAIVGPERNQLLLSVAFDGPWEPYMRQIWRDLGPLLDVILCNCEGYLLAHEHSFADYIAWVRAVQVPTEYFYEASLLTVSDMHVLRERETERLQGPRLLAAALNPAQVVEQALPGLVVLFGLTDLYPPQAGSADGAILWRAARLLLRDLETSGGVGMPIVAHTPTERAAWSWFFTYVGDPRRGPLPGPLVDQRVLQQVQGGILQPYPRVTHGALLLLSLADAAAAQALLEALLPLVSTGLAPNQPDARSGEQGSFFYNLAFTLAGLQRCGLSDGQLEELPVDFREGMAARFGTLGDWDHNHPSRWALPHHRLAGEQGPERVHLPAVHAVLQLHWQGQASDDWDSKASRNAWQVLKLEVARIEVLIGQGEPAADRQRRGAGVQVLAIEPMQRMAAEGAALPRGHFGYLDGISQPHTALGGRSVYSSDADEVPLGDLLLGHGNGLQDDPQRGVLWVNGSFLVVRKLQQDVAAWRQALADAPSADREAIESQLMGRTADGHNLINKGVDNRFDYSGDEEGTRCPFHAHVRRANPRTPARPELRHLPRLMRRGMSYGPRLPEGKTDDDGAERGLMFMAYNASISEQFELIQAWLAGGNSADAKHSWSALRDPFLGVRQPGDPGVVPYVDAQQDAAVFKLPDRPLVTLQWGLYLFAPAIDALRELLATARQVAEDESLARAAPRSEEPNLQQKTAKDSVERRRLALQLRWARESALGAALIARLKAAEGPLGAAGAVDRWKAVLEDAGAAQSGTTQAVWTAIRQAHKGCLRTPYGVLVGSATLVDQVLQDDERRYSVSGYAARMAKSFGPIYLGLDAGPEYDAESERTNSFIMEMKLEDGFHAAHGHAAAAITRLTTAAAPLPPGGKVTVQVRDLVDEVLAATSFDWFGLPDGQFVKAGGWRWQPHEEASCPGHFHAPSRYMFWPRPGPDSEQIGQRHGAILKRQVKKFVGEQRRANPPQCGMLGNRMLDHFADDEKLASTLIGVMMGYLPTVDGNVRLILAEWIQNDTLWSLQDRYLAVLHAALRAAPGADAQAVADIRRMAAMRSLAPELIRSLQRHPVPPLLWRTALTAHPLGPVQVNPGDRIVLGLGSAAMERLDRDQPDPYTVFGGKRTGDPASANSADRANNGPTHACPGRRLAMGVMLGLLAALLERPSIAPSGSPTALCLEASPPPNGHA